MRAPGSSACSFSLGAALACCALLSATSFGLDKPTWLGPRPPAQVRRVITLAPSLTETVQALGAGDRLVGVSRYDVDPALSKVPRVGGFIDPSVESVVALAPHLLLVQPSPGNRAPVEKMAELGVPVLALPLDSIAATVQAILEVGRALGLSEKAATLVAELEAKRARVREQAKGRKSPRVFIVYSWEPLVVAGPGSFAHELLGDAGAINAAGKASSSYPVFSVESAVRARPDVVVDAAHESIGSQRLRTLPGLKQARWVKLRSEDLMHPGPHLARGLEELFGALHPVSFSATLGGRFTLGRAVPVLVALGGVCLLVFAASVSFGAESISLIRVFEEGSSDEAIFWSLRFPRAGLSALVGAALAASGCTLQAVMRNPLADPFVLGVSGGAALGATIALALGVGTLGGAQLGVLAWVFRLSGPSVFALVGALGATVLVFSVGRAAGQRSPHATLLSGVIFNTFALAAITFIKTLAAPEKLGEILYWLAGSLGYPSATALGAAFLFELLAIGAMWAASGRLNLLMLGDDDAASLGVAVEKTRLFLLIAASLSVAVAVSLSGLVAFVGLIVPHVLRLWLGPDQRLLLPASVLGGAAFLMVSDLLARSLFSVFGSEPPVGAITALLGGPLFLSLLVRGDGRRQV